MYTMYLMYYHYNVMYDCMCIYIHMDTRNFFEPMEPIEPGI